MEDQISQRIVEKVPAEEVKAGGNGKVRVAVARIADTGNLLKRSVKHLIPIKVKANADTLSQLESSVQSELETNSVAVDSKTSLEGSDQWRNFT